MIRATSLLPIPVTIGFKCSQLTVCSLKLSAAGVVVMENSK